MRNICYTSIVVDNDTHPVFKAEHTSSLYPKFTLHAFSKRKSWTAWIELSYLWFVVDFKNKKPQTIKAKIAVDIWITKIGSTVKKFVNVFNGSWLSSIFSRLLLLVSFTGFKPVFAARFSTIVEIVILLNPIIQFKQYCILRLVSTFSIAAVV